MRLGLRSRLVALLLVLTSLLAVPLGGVVGTAHAQTAAVPASDDIDFDAWADAADDIERLIEGGVASTAFFETQRANVSRWRARFLAASAAATERIATVQSQIDALGPEPADGAAEPPSLVARRAILETRLAQAQAPQVQANEAFNRANGLIAEIDALLLERQTQELMEWEPSALNPVNWATALRAMIDLTVSLNADLQRRGGDPATRAALADNAPILLALILIGLLIILRGRAWVSRLGDRFLDGDGRRGRAALGFMVSLGQLVLPVLGFVMIVQAFEVSGLLSMRGETILRATLALIAAVYTALWLAGRLFPDHGERAAAFDANRSQRNIARWVIFLIGLLTGMANFAQIVADLNVVPPAARGVLVVPVHLGLGLVYLRLGRLLRRFRTNSTVAEGSSFTPRVLGIMTTALTVIAVVGPLLGLAGYVNAAEALMLPTALTLFVLGVLLALHAVTLDLYALAFRTTHQAASEALLPVLVNMGLFLLALPVLAVSWGMRPDRLGELLVRALEGFTLGNTRITPGIVLAVVIVFGAGILITRLLQGALKSTILPRTRMDVGARNALTAGVGYVGVGLAALIAVTSAGIDLTALGFVLGALSVGIGFGLQNVVSNFVSGIILLIERPISEGDWIEVNGNMGIVKAISVRSTRIETFDKTDLIVPNADFISGTVTNWTRGNTVGRVMLNVGVAYGTDTRRVGKILQEIAESHPDVSRFPEPGVDFMGFGADSLDFRIRLILRDVNRLGDVRTEVNHRIAERFVAEGIEIPFRQRDIWLRNPEALVESVRKVPLASDSVSTTKDA